MFGLFKDKFKEYGSALLDTSWPELIEAPCRSFKEWSDNSTEKEAQKNLLIFVASHILFYHIGSVTDAQNNSLITGLFQNIKKKFPDVPNEEITKLFGELLRAASADLKNKDKTETFPSLVELSVQKVACLNCGDPKVPTANALFYDILEILAKTTLPSLEAFRRNK